MELKVAYIVNFVILIAGLAIKTMLMLFGGNVYLTVAYSFLLVFGFFLGICYLRKIFSEKLLKLTILILSTIFYFAIVAEAIYFYTSR